MNTRIKNEVKTDSNSKQATLINFSKPILLLSIIEKAILSLTNVEKESYSYSRIEKAKKLICSLRDDIGKWFTMFEKVIFPDDYQKTYRVIGDYVFTKLPNNEISVSDKELLGVELKNFHLDYGFVIRVKNHELETSC